MREDAHADAVRHHEGNHDPDPDPNPRYHRQRQRRHHHGHTRILTMGFVLIACYLFSLCAARGNFRSPFVGAERHALFVVSPSAPTRSKESSVVGRSGASSSSSAAAAFYNRGGTAGRRIGSSIAPGNGERGHCARGAPSASGTSTRRPMSRTGRMAVPGPDEAELAQQKFETARGFSDYNDGTWVGTRVTSFSVTSDAAAGVTRRVDRRCDREGGGGCYRTTGRTILDSDGLNRLETVSWTPADGGGGDGDDDDSDNVCVSSRTTKLNSDSSIDVDSIDGTYSLDASPLLDLPSFITGTDAMVKFGVEHGIAVSDDSRVRVFLLYGLDDRLERVVVCDEERAAATPSSGGGESAAGADDESDPGKGDFAALSQEAEASAAMADVDALVSRILGDDDGGGSVGGKGKIIDISDLGGGEAASAADASSSSSSPSPSPSPSNQGTKRITELSTVEERMAQLERAMAANSDATASSPAAAKGEADGDEVVIQRCPMSMFGLINGVWLGDAVVRNHFGGSEGAAGGAQASSSKKGFGGASKKGKENRRQQPTPGSGMSDGFAEWYTGVQKVALTFKWDFEERVLQRVDAGRNMGASISNQMPSSSAGSLVVNDMARGKDPEDRLIYVDFDMGTYAAFVLGSVYVKAPRSLSFSSSTGKVRPFFTECAVFQKRTIAAKEGNGDVRAIDSSVDYSTIGGKDSILENDAQVEPPEMFCSRSTRLYGSDGRLSQGTSAFFTLSHPT